METRLRAATSRYQSPDINHFDLVVRIVIALASMNYLALVAQQSAYREGTITVLQRFGQFAFVHEISRPIIDAVAPLS